VAAPGDRDFRGSVESSGQFAITDKWVWGWDGVALTDKTFLQGVDTATSQMFAPPDQVVAELKAAEAAGATAALWFGTLPGARPDATLSLFETLSKEVMPAFR